MMELDWKASWAHQERPQVPSSRVRGTGEPWTGFEQGQVRPGLTCGAYLDQCGRLIVGELIGVVSAFGWMKEPQNRRGGASLRAHLDPGPSEQPAHWPQSQQSQGKGWDHPNLLPLYPSGDSL